MRHKPKKPSLQQTINKTEQIDVQMMQVFTQMEDPFSFAATDQNTKSIDKKENFPQTEILELFINKEPQKKEIPVHHQLDSTNCHIYENLEAKTGANLTQEILNKLSSSISNNIKQNIALSKDLLNCRNANDLIEFQQKLFHTNFPPMINLYMEISQDINKFNSQNFKTSISISQSK